MKVDGGANIECKLCETKLEFNGSATSSMRDNLPRRHVTCSTAVAATDAKVSQAKSADTMQKFLGRQQFQRILEYSFVARFGI